MYPWMLFSIFLIQKCGAVIYHLNDTEYNAMPPLFGLDEYNNCLQAADGTYCVARFDLHAGPNVELMKLIQEYSKHTKKHYNHSYIERGICLTETCRTFLNNKDINKVEDLSVTLEACINDTMWKSYGLQATLSNLYYCDKHGEQDEINSIDRVVQYVIIILIALNVIGSVYDICQQKFKWNENQYLNSFSIFKNWDYLTTLEPAGSKMESFKALYGIKTLTAVFVILGHVLFMYGTGIIDNTHDFEKLPALERVPKGQWSEEEALNKGYRLENKSNTKDVWWHKLNWGYESPHLQILISGMAIVQIFFVISGFMLVYNLEVYSERQKINWSLTPKLLFFRWSRVTPALAVMVAFSATWLRRLGSGPLWKHSVGTVVGDCRQYWWTHVLYINNYFPNNKYCAVQTWHVAADMQLFCVGLITYIATRNRGRWLAMVSLLLVGMIAPALHVWWQDFDGLCIMSPEFYRNLGDDNFRKLHVFGYNNLPCVVVGMAVGYLTYDWQKRGVDLSKYKVYKHLYVFTIPAIIAVFYSGNQFFANEERASLALRMAYASLHRVLLGVITGLSLIAIVMKFEDNFRNFFEWRGWVVPGRLTFSVYLLHMHMIHVLLGGRTTLDHVSFYNLLITYLGITTLAFIFALPYHLLVESSMNRFMKAIMDYNWKIEKKMK